MGLIKLLAAPIRSVVRFPLFQLAVVVAVILLLQAADDKSASGHIFNGLDKLVESTVRLLSAVFNVKSFTKSWLTSSFWIAYVYLACLLILSIVRVTIRAVVDFVGWSNAFGLRNAIARERGIAAYRAWVPFERIRPDNISQEKWEETFAWPANNKPPYPPLAQRILRGVISYVVVILVAAVLLQVFTPFPFLTWLAELTKMLI
ncbi:MAG: hypothetical protein WBW99_07350 [Pseudolabrys sp.]